MIMEFSYTHTHTHTYTHTRAHAHTHTRYFFPNFECNYAYNRFFGTIIQNVKNLKKSSKVLLSFLNSILMNFWSLWGEKEKIPIHRKSSIALSMIHPLSSTKENHSTFGISVACHFKCEFSSFCSKNGTIISDFFSKIWLITVYPVYPRLWLLLLFSARQLLCSSLKIRTKNLGKNVKIVQINWWLIKFGAFLLPEK